MNASEPLSALTDPTGASALATEIGKLVRVIEADHAGSNGLSTGEKAALRRLDPACVDGRHQVALARALHAIGKDGVRGPERADWTLIVNAVALGLHGGHHNPKRPLGAALAEVDGENATSKRLDQLLTADRHTLDDLMPRVARRLAAKNQTANWSDAAWLILTAAPDHSAHNTVRARIVRDWVRGARMSETATPKGETA